MLKNCEKIKHLQWSRVYTYCYEQLGKLILQWLPLDRYQLCMDRTNWQHGSRDINYLVVSIAWQGASVTIAWICLEKGGGNSNMAERIVLTERVLKRIPADKIDGLLADREFIGQEWFQWLQGKQLLCRLRIRSNISVIDRYGKEIPAGQLCRCVNLNQNVVWHAKRKVSGVPLYIAARRTLKGLLILVATEKPETMIEDYYKRRSIETLFGCLKSRSFDLESTHMTDPEKMDKLMGLLSLEFTWCLISRHWKCGEAKQLPLNKHGRPAKSLFRLGLDLLRRVLKNFCTKSNQANFLRLLNVLSRT